MSESAHDAEHLQRECVVAALAGPKLCPAYHLPCWACLALHLLTGVMRAVTSGRFAWFQEGRFRTFDPGADYSELLLVGCVHSPTTFDDDYYWRARDGSSISTPEALP